VCKVALNLQKQEYIYNQLFANVPSSCTKAALIKLNTNASRIKHAVIWCSTKVSDGDEIFKKLYASNLFF